VGGHFHDAVRAAVGSYFRANPYGSPDWLAADLAAAIEEQAQASTPAYIGVRVRDLPRLIRFAQGREQSRWTT
jgi:hypothetical protein